MALLFMSLRLMFLTLKRRGCDDRSVTTVNLEHALESYSNIHLVVCQYVKEEETDSL